MQVYDPNAESQVDNRDPRPWRLPNVDPAPVYHGTEHGLVAAYYLGDDEVQDGPEEGLLAGVALAEWQAPGGDWSEDIEFDH